MSTARRRSVLAVQVGGGVFTAVASLFVGFVLTVGMGFALSTCEDESSTTELALVALALAVAAAAVPALVGLVLRLLGADGRTWFGVALGWVVAGLLAVLVVSQATRCT